MFLTSVAVILSCEMAFRFVMVDLLGLSGSMFVGIAVPLSTVAWVLIGKWTMGAVARRQGKPYRADPAERLFMRLQLRYQLRQLKK